jgi:virulence-associated protein VapD
MSVTPIKFGATRGAGPAKRIGRVYAIAFDIDTQAAERVIGEGWKSCYDKIDRVLSAHGFRRQQGSLFFGNEYTNAVCCVNAVQEIDTKYAWFGRVVRDLRMLRIDEDNDLLPALSNRFRFDDASNVA